jgi:hypothetical protein
MLQGLPETNPVIGTQELSTLGVLKSTLSISPKIKINGNETCLSRG